MKTKLSLMALLGAVALPALAARALPAGFDTAPKIEQGFKALLADESNRKRYCEMQQLNAQATAAYQAGDPKKSVGFTKQAEAIAKTLPAHQGYMGISVQKAMDSTFFTSAPAVAMNAAVSAVIKSCHPGKP